MKNDNITFWIWLALKEKISSKKLFMLYRDFGSAENIYNLSPSQLSLLSYLKERDIELLSDKDLGKIPLYARKLGDAGAFLLTIDSPYYPKKLLDLKDPPVILHCKGRLQNLNQMKCISIVGTRNPTDYGYAVTDKITRKLTDSKVAIISGMALGVDAIAHGKTMGYGGYTVAVLGCGVDVIYPKTNTGIYNDLSKYGLIISEYPLGTLPERYHFPQRNRIIASLSDAVAVTEAGEKSGSLLTADYARKLGRKIFAVPGNVISQNAQGTNMLISSGAELLSDGEEILRFLKIDKPKRKRNFDIPENPDDYLPIDRNALKSRINFDKGAYNIVREDQYIIPPEETKDAFSKGYNIKKAPAPKEEKQDRSFTVDDEKERLIIESLGDVPISPDEISLKTGISISELNMKLLLMEVRGKIKKNGTNLYYATD